MPWELISQPKIDKFRFSPKRKQESISKNKMPTPGGPLTEERIKSKPNWYRRTKHVS